MPAVALGEENKISTFLALINYNVNDLIIPIEQFALARRALSKLSYIHQRFRTVTLLTSLTSRRTRDAIL